MQKMIAEFLQRRSSSIIITAVYLNELPVSEEGHHTGDMFVKVYSHLFYFLSLLFLFVV